MVWHHHNLTTAQSDRLEALQSRALRIILHPVTLPYNIALALCEIGSLKLRRCNFQQKFFKQICHPGNCLHDLLPHQRNPFFSLRLRHSTVYPIPQEVRTKRYCSFINYSLKCYQWQPFMFVIAPFHFILCVYVVHIVFLCNFHDLYLYLCFILVVFYIVNLYYVSL